LPEEDVSSVIIDAIGSMPVRMTVAGNVATANSADLYTCFSVGCTGFTLTLAPTVVVTEGEAGADGSSSGQDAAATDQTLLLNLQESQALPTGTDCTQEYSYTLDPD
jgi:hypothetical protein